MFTFVPGAYERGLVHDKEVRRIKNEGDLERLEKIKGLFLLLHKLADSIDVYDKYSVEEILPIYVELERCSELFRDRLYKKVEDEKPKKLEITLTYKMQDI